MKKVTLHSTKDVDDLLKVIRDRTDEYHAIYLKRPSQWVSSIRENRIMIGKYYFFTGPVRCLYGTILPRDEGCVIEGELRMLKGHKRTLWSFVILCWCFALYGLVTSCDYVSVVDIILILIKDIFVHASLGGILIVVIWNYIVEHGELDEVLLEFLNNML